MISAADSQSGSATRIIYSRQAGAPRGVQLPLTFARHHHLMRLLVVDDDPSVREALALILDLNGFELAFPAADEPQGGR